LQVALRLGCQANAHKKACEKNDFVKLFHVFNFWVI
jgi:hypothetical protein